MTTVMLEMTTDRTSRCGVRRTWVRRVLLREADDTEAGTHAPALAIDTRDFRVASPAAPQPTTAAGTYVVTVTEMTVDAITEMITDAITERIIEATKTATELVPAPPFAALEAAATTGIVITAEIATTPETTTIAAITAATDSEMGMQARTAHSAMRTTLAHRLAAMLPSPPPTFPNLRRLALRSLESDRLRRLLFSRPWATTGASRLRRRQLPMPSVSLLSRQLPVPLASLLSRQPWDS